MRGVKCVCLARRPCGDRFELLTLRVRTFLQTEDISASSRVKTFTPFIPFTMSVFPSRSLSLCQCHASGAPHGPVHAICVTFLSYCEEHGCCGEQKGTKTVKWTPHWSPYWEHLPQPEGGLGDSGGVVGSCMHTKQQSSGTHQVNLVYLIESSFAKAAWTLLTFGQTLK